MRAYFSMLVSNTNLYYSLLFLLFNSCWNQSFAQKSNSAYLEIGGAGSHYSFNYERQIVQTDKFSFYASVGFSPTLLNNEGFSPRVPILLKFGFPVTRGLEVEVGGGITPYWYTYRTSGYNARQGYSYEHKYTESDSAWSGRVGIRQRLGQTTYLGLYYTPWFKERYDGGKVTHWGALTIGKAF